MNSIYRVVCLGIFVLTSLAMAKPTEYLIKFSNLDGLNTAEYTRTFGGSLTLVSQPGQLYKWTVEEGSNALSELRAANSPNVDFVQPNYPIRLFANPSIVKHRKALWEAFKRGDIVSPNFGEDNPAIQQPPAQGSGSDPQMSNSWGLTKINASLAWQKTPKGKGIIVAVTDTGIDYNHEDLIHNMWRNTDEIAGDGIDNDNNGYVDDMVGWDFAKNDNLPFDLAGDLFEILLTGANPGHGTHCAGVIGAAMNNGKGSAGVAPEVQLMAMRFIGEAGQGDTAGAVGAIDYAVANGAHVISASWGSQGEEEGDNALRESIQRAADAGVLFVAAAGNGRVDQAAGAAVGYDNDTDSKPSYPATYPHENIVSVSALDVQDALAPFSNWGHKSVDIGAPGVKILSTVPGNRYQDTIIDLGEMMKVTWDGTSMATPHVAGAAALIWSADLDLSMADVKGKLLNAAIEIPSLKGKVSTDGRLDLNGIVTP